MTNQITAPTLLQVVAKRLFLQVRAPSPVFSFEFAQFNHSLCTLILSAYLSHSVSLALIQERCRRPVGECLWL